MTAIASAAPPLPAVTSNLPAQASNISRHSSSTAPLVVQGFPSQTRLSYQDNASSIELQQSPISLQSLPAGRPFPCDSSQETSSIPPASSNTRRSIGYLGATSSSAIIAELDQNLGFPPAVTINEPCDQIFPDDYLQRGAEVVAYFANISGIDRFLAEFLEGRDGFFMYSPVYRFWAEGMVPVFQKIAGPGDLAAMASSLSSNTGSLLPCSPETTVRGWALQATGACLRWETLGLFLAEIGVIASVLPAWDKRFRDGLKKRDMINSTFRLLRICVSLSKRYGGRSDLLLCLLSGNMIFTSIIRGDTSSETWNNSSEVCDMAILLGMHLKTPLNDSPFFLQELRVRLFNLAYSMDKFLATFLGRPSRLSYRYCMLREPHDLNDAEIYYDSHELQKRLAELDTNNGWSTTGAPSQATWRKVFSKRHILREEILEIVISPHTVDIASSLDYVRIQEQNAFASMPNFCRTDPEHLITELKHDPTLHIPNRGVPWQPMDVQRIIALHAASRHAVFLLERTAVVRAASDPSRLIQAARSLLNLVLKATLLREFLVQFRIDLIEMLAFYAVPAAGVLAIHVLKNDRLGNHLANFERSDVLQQLSVLVAALEAVQLDECNQPICALGSSAIKRVLNTLLSERLGRTTTVAATHLTISDIEPGPNLSNDADFLQWLGNMELEMDHCEIPV